MQEPFLPDFHGLYATALLMQLGHARGTAEVCFALSKPGQRHTYFRFAQSSMPSASVLKVSRSDDSEEACIMPWVRKSKGQKGCYYKYSAKELSIVKSSRLQGFAKLELNCENPAEMVFPSMKLFSSWNLWLWVLLGLTKQRKYIMQ